jgi:hypothetical protein
MQISHPTRLLFMSIFVILPPTRIFGQQEMNLLGIEL